MRNVVAAVAGFALASSVGAAAMADAQPRRRAPTRHPVGAVGVREHEFRITLSRPRVRSGWIVVEADNEGQDAHDLALAQVGSDRRILAFPTLGPGRRGVGSVVLTRGSYRLWCTLPGHDAAGMHALLVVS